MPTFTLMALATVLLAQTEPAAGEPLAAPAMAPLPLPPALVPQVEFWKRIYSQVDSHHALMHDARHMDVVYATVALPTSGSYRAERRFMRAQAARQSAILRTLAAGKRTALSDDEQAALAAWPADVTAAELREAAQNVRLQTGQKERFIAGLVRAQPWMPLIERTIAEHGLPRELAALPHVESSFDMRAYSKARAAGIWQFTGATAKLYMQMNSAVDERYDPIRATEAAARLLRNNHEQLAAWPIAITAYNHGTEGMKRAVRSEKTDDIAAIVAHYHTKRFGFASRNFYTELLAAWDVSQHAAELFGPLPAAEPVTTVATMSYLKAASVATALGVDLATLKANNPALKPAVWQNQRYIPRGFNLRVPQAIAPTELLARLDTIPAGERFAKPVPEPVMVARRHSKPSVVVAQRTAKRHVAPTAAPTAAEPPASLAPAGGAPQEGPWAVRF